MPVSKEEFGLFKAHQYCDNPECSHYNLAGQDNIKTHSFQNAQCYCNQCHGKPFSIRKGTMFFDLRTPIDKIVRVLSLLVNGMGKNAVCRLEGVSGESVSSWLVLAAKHVEAFTTYLQKDMHLTQVQIDEFWSFIRKKKNT